MLQLETPPSWVTNLFTIGISRARWIAESNQRLGQGGAGFAFAWFFLAFANYGLAERMNGALRHAGSPLTVSPIVCFLFTSWPFFGSNAQFRTGTQALNDAYAGQQQVAAPPAA
jgi:hypothetical protein